MGIWDRVKQGFGDLVDDLTLDDALRAQIDEAEAAIAIGEIERAEHVLEQITRARPQHGASWAMLGECQLKLGKSDLA
ncbi:MAG: hypothetical protein KC503_34475, partial [Myxococcales bacterium]|nr:hypothetical protein [Myxococcales bacterium]